MIDTFHQEDESSVKRSNSFRNRVIIVACIGVFIVFIILARLVNIQIVNYESYSTISDENRFKVKAIPPPRGYLYDRDGEILADARFILTLSINEEQVDDLNDTIATLRELLELTDEHIVEFEKARAARARPFRPVPIKRDLTEEETVIVALNRHLLPGVIVSTESLRNYPHAELTVHALGVVRRLREDDLADLDKTIYSVTDFVGGTGVEKFYESLLHGLPGNRIVEVDVHQREIRVLTEQIPIRGNDIFLHLDIDLQKAAWEGLGERRGAVVAIDTRTGGILAMVSKPAYDPNVFIGGISAQQYQDLQDPIALPLFNRALNATYAPGSTFKPIVALAALSHGVTTWDRVIEDRGTFRLKNTRNSRVWRDWNWSKNNPGGQGSCDLDRALYRSSNIYFCTVAEELGVDNISSFAKQFGFGERMAFDLPDAATGILPSVEWKRTRTTERWQPGDTVNMGIGQGFMLVTPLQMAQIASTIARKGTWIQPRMFMYSPQEMEGFDMTVQTRPPISGPTEEDWQKLHEALINVVHRGNMGYGENGTAWAHIGIGTSYEMAGKSGTAQTIAIPAGEEYDEEEIPEQYRDHAWFMAFAPARAPEIAVVALVENGGGGSAVAGPVVRAVLDQYMKDRLPPDDA